MKNLNEYFEKLDEKDKLIIQCSKNEFASCGFHNANLDTIAMEAGVGKGTIYRRFKTKKSLFFATLGFGYWEYLKKIMNIDFNMDFESLITQFLDLFCEYTKDHIEMHYLFIHQCSKMIEGDKRNKFIEKIKYEQAKFIEFWHNILKKGRHENKIRKELDLDTLSIILFNTHRAIFMDLLLEKMEITNELLEIRKKYFLEIILKGLIEK